MIDQLDRVLALLREGRSFLVITHENPDGDAIGALLGLTLALRNLGKAADPYDVDAMPGYLTWVPGANLLRREADPAAYDVICALDCGAADRMGPLSQRVLAHPRVVDIDHHTTNEGYGAANLVVPKASSTSEILVRVLNGLGATITPEVATLLYLGVYTDTTMFQNSAATPDAFRVCGELVAAGADFLNVARRVYIDTSAARLMLLARVLSTLQIDADGRIAGMVCAKRHLDELGLGPDEMETFVEYPRAIIGVRAAYLLREVDGAGLVKGSLRAVGDFDVSTVAAQFGGGGHKKAAGFRTQGELADVRARVVELLGRLVGRA
jgi:phosphoesterase RecJ-like protein